MEETANAPGSANWFSAVEAPERAEAGAAWDAEADLVVVGCGGAGLAAALEGAERGLSVLALDRTAGGGSTAINGGILYAGGGTAVQKQAGVEDTPEAMFQYLRGDTQGVVADATLLRFCNESAAMVDWLMRHGVHFEARKYEPKTSYPPRRRGPRPAATRPACRATARRRPASATPSPTRCAPPRRGSG
jgi:3-oxo-5alpha-steroid 4-dehydrogenase